MINLLNPAQKSDSYLAPQRFVQLGIQLLADCDKNYIHKTGIKLITISLS